MRSLSTRQKTLPRKMSINDASLVSFDAIRALGEALSGKPVARLIYERDGVREELTVMQQVD